MLFDNYILIYGEHNLVPFEMYHNLSVLVMNRVRLVLVRDKTEKFDFKREIMIGNNTIIVYVLSFMKQTRDNQ